MLSGCICILRTLKENGDPEFRVAILSDEQVDALLKPVSTAAKIAVARSLFSNAESFMFVNEAYRYAEELCGYTFFTEDMPILIRLEECF